MSREKSALSKNLLQMKFMQRTALRVQKEESESEQQRYIDDEHWFLDIPELAEKESKYQVQPSYAVCEQLKFGRMSFKGFNPEIEKIMRLEDSEQELRIAGEKEREIAVDDLEMAKRYSTLVGTVGKKFAKKRHREEIVEQDIEIENSEESDRIEAIVKRKLSQLMSIKKKKQTEFQKPSDD